MKRLKKFRAEKWQHMDRLRRWPEIKRWHAPVGNALHKNPDPEKIPCYRVVNAKGELAGEFAFGGEGAQARLLQADGIAVIDGRVDLKIYGI